MPDKGYKIGKITVMYKNGKEIKPDELNGKYSFKMPAGNVSIKVVFEKDKQSDENPFNDVNKTDHNIRRLFSPHSSWVFLPAS